MKKVIVLTIITLSLFTGCLTTVPTTSDDIVQFPAYGEDAKIDHVIFNLPSGYSTKNVTITCTLYLPDGTSPGTYTDKFSGTRTCNINIAKLLLYYPGTWKATYAINNGKTEIIGNQYLWVEDKEVDLDRYIVESYTDSGSDIHFYVYNNGNQPGYVEIEVYATNPLNVGEKVYYGKSFLERTEYIRPGHRKSFVLSITETSSITIMLNGEKFKYG